MPQREDLTGNVYGKWTVLALSGIRNRRSVFTCVCGCGKTKKVVSSTLKNGHSTSCGCNIGIASRARLTKHGMATTKPHMIWCTMRQRCGNPSSRGYKDYGGRGISICDRWGAFENFWEDMGPTWADGLSIERIDVNGNYEPDNCCWIPKGDQAANRRPSSEWNFKNENSIAGRSVSNP